MKIHHKLNKKFTVEQAFIILSAQKAKIYEKQIFELFGYDIPDEMDRG